MRVKRVIPCLDVAGGRVMKGVHFANLRDAGDPVELALRYDQAGADELVFLDISATPEGRATRLDWVRAVAQKLSIPFTVGGGISSLEAIEAVLQAGADKVVLNTAAVAQPVLVREAAERFGSARIVVAIDARRVAGGDRDGTPRWEVVTHGGREAAGLEPVVWARVVEALGAGEILLTSMDADGTQAGYDLELTRAVARAVRIPVIASGGAGTLEHLRAALQEGEADGVLAASIFHDGRHTVAEAKAYLAQAGVPVRHGIPSTEEGLAGGLRFGPDGLIPVVVQSAGEDQAVLMLAYMNREALQKTLATGTTWFWSRSRQELWPKGATSGNRQRVVEVRADCDRDALLVRVAQEGTGACHTGAWSCFHQPLPTPAQEGEAGPEEARGAGDPGTAGVGTPDGARGAAEGPLASGPVTLPRLLEVVRDRQARPRPGSYTTYLFEQGLDKILKKVGEEATEVVVAAKNGDRDGLVGEIGDLLYHLAVLMVERGVGLEQVEAELTRRHGPDRPPRPPRPR